MRREYFTLTTRLPSAESSAPTCPTIVVEFDGPIADLRAALDDDAGEPLPAEAVDVTCRLQGESATASGVLGLTHRLTGEFLLEVDADADAILDLVDAARASDDEDASYRVRIESDDGPTVFDKETLLVYDSDGNLLRGQSLIPSGVEL